MLLTTNFLIGRYGAPAPLFCRPKKDKNDFTGSWNYGFFCNVPWVDPPITCDDYEGQKAGKFDNEEVSLEVFSLPKSKCFLMKILFHAAISKPKWQNRC